MPGGLHLSEWNQMAMCVGHLIHQETELEKSGGLNLEQDL
jgi:hypothetical protein|tara:strand:- start:351 stop:470 length:120 start_codon:yes stop_codon:yes gene_type:complete